MSVSDLSLPGGACSPSSQSPNNRKQDKIVKCPWTKEDDIKVGELVEQYGTKSWSALAAHLPGRTGKQIRERWHNQVQSFAPIRSLIS
jgi:hypothetical protein